jgi:hypothetical protein
VTLDVLLMADGWVQALVVKTIAFGGMVPYFRQGKREKKR